MKIVISGASGFLGRHLIQALADAGHTGIATARRPITDLPSGWSVISRAAALTGGFDGPAPEALIHLEVKQHVSRVMPDDRAEFTHVNVDGTQQWLDWCTARGVRRMIFFSSVKAVPPADGRVPGPYGRSKRAAEMRVEKWAKENFGRSALIVRPAVIYGPHSVGNMINLVRAIDRGWFMLPGAARNLKPIVSVRNVCAAVTFLVERAEAGCWAYNLVDPNCPLLGDVANFVAAELGRKPPSRMPLFGCRLAAVLGDIYESVLGRSAPLNSFRLEAMLEHQPLDDVSLHALGFRFPESTETGLKAFVRWYRTSLSSS